MNTASTDSVFAAVKSPVNRWENSLEKVCVIAVDNL